MGPSISTQPPGWLTYPNSAVRLVFRPGANGGELDVMCNAQGLGSLIGVFLWLTSFSDYGSLSVSALSFVHPDGPLAFAVVIADPTDQFAGKLVRQDKDRQFEWQVHEDSLTQVALALVRVATSPDYVGYLSVNVSPESHAGLRFEITDAT